MVESALRTQAKIAERQVQSASGSISSDFGGLGAGAKKVIDLQVSVSQSKALSDAATSANDRVQVMYSTTGSIADLLTSFKSQLGAASSVSGADQSSLQSAASEMLEEMASLLNTQSGGRYLFAGARTETAPVDLSSYAATSATTPDSSYYQGDGQIASVKVSASQSISYGVTADDSAFEQALRAISMIANGTSVDSATITDAMDLTTSALDDVIGVQSRLSLTSSQLERAVSNQTSFQDYATTLGSSLTDVDVAAVTVQISTLQSQLEASYSAIAKIQGLRLVDYLR
jgi:flagellar hook-associated protein 3 FlgL